MEQFITKSIDFRDQRNKYQFKIKQNSISNNNNDQSSTEDKLIISNNVMTMDELNKFGEMLDKEYELLGNNDFMNNFDGIGGTLVSIVGKFDFEKKMIIVILNQQRHPPKIFNIYQQQKKITKMNIIEP